MRKPPRLFESAGRLVGIDIVLMLFGGLGVDCFAVALGVEIVIRGLFRIESGIDGFRTGVADGSGRQTFVFVGVVRVVKGGIKSVRTAPFG